jgi:hypothetical protein
MTRTDGRWEQSTPFTDAQIFERSFTAIGTQPTPTSPGPGLFYYAMAAASTYNFFISLATLVRSGQLATSAVNQEQFGTAALQPGPSLVPNTTDPRAAPAGFPPYTNALNPVLTGGLKTPIPKGIQINAIDVIYEIDGNAATSVTAGLTLTQFPIPPAAPAAPVVTNLIALGANGLSTAANTAGFAKVTRLTVPTPSFNSFSDVETLFNLNFVLPAGSTAKLYGAIFLASFNYN